MAGLAQQAILDFYTYPPVGGDDWRYTFQTAQDRAFETQMLAKSTLLDMANAGSFQQAAELLNGTEYACPRAAGTSPKSRTSCSSGERRCESFSHSSLSISLSWSCSGRGMTLRISGWPSDER